MVDDLLGARNLLAERATLIATDGRVHKCDGITALDVQHASYHRCFAKGAGDGES